MSAPAPEFEELRLSLQRLRSLLENLVVRGLRACGPDELGQLHTFAEDMERSGAGHAASLLVQLHGQAENGERSSARTLLMAQTAVRLLERLLTVRVVQGRYQLAIQCGDKNGGGAEDGGGADGDVDDDRDDGEA